jgi:succinoglycan biosynthesis transport protein ExoP
MSSNRHLISLGRSDFFPNRGDTPNATSYPEAKFQSTGAAADGGRMLTAADIIRTLRRRVRLVLATAITLTALIALLIFELTPKYDAQAVIVLEARTARIANIQDVMPGLPTDNPAMHGPVIRSELDVLTSRSLVRRVIEDTGLANEPEFNPALQTGPGWLGRSLFWMSEQDQSRIENELQTRWNQLRPASGLTAVGEPDPLGPVIEAYLANLTVKTDGKSLTFFLTFRSENSELAARVANRHAQLYLESHVSLKADATKRANSWLAQRVEELRGQVIESERAVQAYRVQNNLNRMPGAEATSMYGEQLSEMNAQLVAARAERAQDEAKLSQAQELLRSKAGFESVPDVLNSSTIQRLREHEAALMRMEAEIAERYRENHPPLLSVRAQLRGLRQQIDKEMQSIVHSLRNSVEIARVRERALERNVEEVRGRLSTANMAEVKLWELEREADARRALLQSFLARFQETSSGSPSERPDARIVSAADVPISPAFPRRKLFLAAGLVLSLMAGAGLALIRDRSDLRVRSLDEIESLTAVPSFGLVPSMQNSWRRRGTAARAIIDDPMSGYAEAIRSVRSALAFSDPGKPPVSVAVTSALPQEGKTTLAASLAQSSALGGRRTILVDCDLRRPGIASLLRQPTVTNIVDVLNGKLRIEDVIHRDDATGLDFIAAPANVANSVDLLNSPRFKELLAKLSSSYERVYIDTPPVLAVPDALAVAQVADALVFAVRWGTPEHVIAAALRQVRAANIHITGTVVTHVDVRRHSKLGYKDPYYYGRYHARSV